MGHGFFSPGLPRLIGQIILDHTLASEGASRPLKWE
jgi:hypothetical protein